MFFIFNKQKIYSYLIATSTVVILLILSFFFTKSDMDVMQTSSPINTLVPICKVETVKKQIALTINCEENTKDIDKILKNLKKCNVKVTFVVSGSWAEKYQNTIKQIVENGHEIALSGDKYIHLKESSYEEVNEQIKSGNAKIKKIIGKEVSIFRSPYGEYTDAILKAVEDNNMKAVSYSINSLDYEGIDASQMWDIINKDLTNRKYNFDAQ